jgi:hypothetical protein
MNRKWKSKKLHKQKKNRNTWKYTTVKGRIKETRQAL